MSKVKCKKCGGNHLSIRCGKKQNSNDFIKVKNKKSRFDRDKKSKFNKDSNFKNNKNYKTKYKNNYSGKFKVVLSNLPNVIENYNITKELNKYGIANFRLKKYDDSTIAFVEFYDKEHADHFINALNGTYCENMVINAEMSKY